MTQRTMAIRTLCSDGTYVTEAAIKSRYSKALKEKHEGQTSFRCEGCRSAQAVHNDHTIAKARCKVIHKSELIWHKGNFVNSCEKCHREWENFKSGMWINHCNVESRLAFLKEHDPEGYTLRIELTQLALSA